MASRRRRLVLSLIVAFLLVVIAALAAKLVEPRVRTRWEIEALFEASNADVPAQAQDLQQYLQGDMRAYDMGWKLLIGRLRHPDPRVRQVAAWTMARVFGLNSFTMPLEGYLAPGDWALIRLCAPRGASDPGPGLQALRTADEGDRIVEVELREPANNAEIAVALLRELRESQDPILRWRAVRVLTLLAHEDRDLFDDLLAHLEREQDPRVLQLLLRTLGGFDLDPPRRQVPAFPADLLQRALGSKERSLRLAAARALGVAALSDELRELLRDDVSAILADPPDPAASPSQEAAWAEADALYLLPVLPPELATLETLLSKTWLEAADSLEARRHYLRLAFHQLGPAWADALEELLDRPRLQHFPDEIRANFVGPRWCEDVAELCPGELPWQALLDADPQRALAWLAKPARKAPGQVSQRRAWLWVSVDQSGAKLAPRRLPLLRSAGARPRQAAAAFLRGWPAATGPVPRQQLLPWLEVVSGIALDLCFASDETGLTALSSFAEAELPATFAEEQLAASLGADLICHALPRTLRSRAEAVRERLRPRLADPETPPPLRGLICVDALNDPSAREAVRLPLKALVAAGPCFAPEDELLILWALARARRLDVDADAMTAALTERLTQLFADNDWPYEGSQRDANLALNMLGRLSPEARRQGEQELRDRRVRFEAVPLDVYWGSFDALADELAAEREEGGHEPLEIDGVGAADGAISPLALAFSVRGLPQLGLDRLELRLRLWSVAKHLASNPPQDDEQAAGWLLAVDALGRVLEGLGSSGERPPGVPATKAEVQAARELIERALGR